MIAEREDWMRSGRQPSATLAKEDIAPAWIDQIEIARAARVARAAKVHIDGIWIEG
jgi:hypothetical protein